MQYLRNAQSDFDPVSFYLFVFSSSVTYVKTEKMVFTPPPPPPPSGLNLLIWIKGIKIKQNIKSKRHCLMELYPILTRQWTKQIQQYYAYRKLNQGRCTKMHSETQGNGHWTWMPMVNTRRTLLAKQQKTLYDAQHHNLEQKWKTVWRPLTT